MPKMTSCQVGSWKQVVAQKENKNATFISLLLLVSNKEHCTRYKKLIFCIRWYY